MSREQIEAMARVVAEVQYLGGLEEKVAERLYNAGYRKQVEVVRCADCAVSHNKWTGCPKLGGLVTTPDFYCAFARPKMKGGAVR